MKNDKKEFDSVKLMRSIRNKIHAKYLNNPELREKELERIRQKYKIINKNSEYVKNKEL